MMENTSPKETPTDTFGHPAELSLDLMDLSRRLFRGLYQILAFAFLGASCAVIGYLLLALSRPIVTSTRVVFSYEGFERGEYPDHSKFQPDDLRAPSIVGEALRRLNLAGTGDLQSKIRAALVIEGMVAPSVIKERDRLRSAGQPLPPFVADEYRISLVWPRRSSLPQKIREELLVEIVNCYRESFQRTYAKPPIAFGGAFSSLQNADYPEYELILRKDVDNILDYLNQQMEQARSFRSQATNLSLKDLVEQTNLFEQTRLNETLGLIRENGLSRDRRMAMVKLDYYVRTLTDQESRAVEEEKLIKDLLNQSQEKSQSYVLGIKSQALQPRDAPLLDQGLIDSLVANDAYNFLLRKDLEAGLQVKRIQSEKSQILAQRENMNSFVKSAYSDQSALLTQVRESLVSLRIAYDQLIDNILKTQGDFSRQHYADAIRLADQVHTEGTLQELLTASAVGFFVGSALGIGLSLLGVYAGRR